MNELTQLNQFTHYSPELDCYFHLSGGDTLYWCGGKWESASVSKQTKARCVPKYDKAAGAPVVDWVNAPVGATMVSRESGIFYRMYNHRIHYFAGGEWREVLQGLDKVTLENLLANPIANKTKAAVKVDWASAPQETTHYDPKTKTFYWLGCHRAHFWDGTHWKHCIMAEHTPTYERLIENPEPMRPAPAEAPMNELLPETAQAMVDHASSNTPFTMVDHATSNTPFTMDCAGYEKLAEVLQAAFDQASAGKGKERHATSLSGGEIPFHEQPMQQIGRRRGIGFILGQADKKSEEAQGMLERGDVGAFEREILGAIVYLAGSIIFAKSGE